MEYVKYLHVSYSSCYKRMTFQDLALISALLFKIIIIRAKVFRSLPVLPKTGPRCLVICRGAVLRSPNVSHLPVQWDDEPRVTWLRPRLAALCLYQVFLIVQMAMKDARWLMPVTYCTRFTPPPPPLTLYILSSALPPSKWCRTTQSCGIFFWKKAGERSDCATFWFILPSKLEWQTPSSLDIILLDTSNTFHGNIQVK